MKKGWNILLVLSLLLGACDEGNDQPGAEQAAAAAEPAPAAQDEQTPVKKLMAEHFEKAWQARDAIIRGDFEEAKKAVGWLAEHEQGEAIPEDVRSLLDPMQKSAREFTEAEDLASAGQSFAQMLTQCGACHEKVEGGPRFEPPEVPEGEELAQHMERHRWAANRMWEGLVGSDPATFQRGAEVLATVEFNPREIPGANRDPKRVKALAKHVHEMAKKAAEAEDTETAVEVYGRFIASCAGCHRLVDGGPTADQPSEPALVK